MINATKTVGCTEPFEQLPGLTLLFFLTPLYTRDARSLFTFVATKSLTSFGVLLPTTVDDDEVDENDVSAVMSVAWIKFSKPVSVDRTENL